MAVNNSNPASTLVDGCFHSMEEVNEVTRAAGWEGEFCQLARGQVTSRWRSLHLNGYALTSHRLDKSVHARQTPPEGCVSLAILPPRHHMFVDGVELGSREALLMASDSEGHFVTPDEAECDTLSLPRADFEASARVLFPRASKIRKPNRIRILRSTPSRISALHRETTRLLHNGSMSHEDVSYLLTRFLDLMAGEAEKRKGEASHDSLTSYRIARRAQEYIEEHYRENIPLEDLCRYTGTSLRTLQRSFSAYFQLSPSAYLKSRRLNSARQGLVTAESPRQTVSQIALDSGFSHLGRFSVDYRYQFGESPKDTLARSLRIKRTSFSRKHGFG